MLSLEKIKSSQTLGEKNIEVKQWDGEVRISQLSTAQRLEITSKYDIKANGEIDVSDIMNLHLDIVSTGVVEPKLSREFLEQLNESSLDAIVFISEQINEFSTAKKK